MEGVDDILSGGRERFKYRVGRSSRLGPRRRRQALEHLGRVDGGGPGRGKRVEDLLLGRRREEEYPLPRPLPERGFFIQHFLRRDDVHRVHDFIPS